MSTSEPAKVARKETREPKYDRFPTTLRFTHRECEYLSTVHLGLNNKEIARKLDVSVETVKSELQRIFRKMQLANRIQAAVWWERNRRGTQHQSSRSCDFSQVDLDRR